MQRDFRKADFPGYFEASASGSALAGENAMEAARRELAEETGITDGHFIELGREVTGINAIFVTYLCLTDWPKEQITLQAEETIDFRWLDEAAFRHFFQTEMIPYQRERLSKYPYHLFKKND